jgi:hypothetical protein
MHPALEGKPPRLDAVMQQILTTAAADDAPPAGFVAGVLARIEPSPWIEAAIAAVALLALATAAWFAVGRQAASFDAAVSWLEAAPGGGGLVMWLLLAAAAQPAVARLLQRGGRA